MTKPILSTQLGLSILRDRVCKIKNDANANELKAYFYACRQNPRLAMMDLEDDIINLLPELTDDEKPTDLNILNCYLEAILLMSDYAQALLQCLNKNPNLYQDMIITAIRFSDEYIETVKAEIFSLAKRDKAAFASAYQMTKEQYAQQTITTILALLPSIEVPSQRNKFASYEAFKQLKISQSNNLLSLDKKAAATIVLNDLANITVDYGKCVLDNNEIKIILLHSAYAYISQAFSLDKSNAYVGKRCAEIAGIYAKRLERAQPMQAIKLGQWAIAYLFTFYKNNTLPTHLCQSLMFTYASYATASSQVGEFEKAVASNKMALDIFYNLKNHPDLKDKLAAWEASVKESICRYLIWQINKTQKNLSLVASAQRSEEIKKLSDLYQNAVYELMLYDSTKMQWIKISLQEINFHGDICEDYAKAAALCKSIFPALIHEYKKKIYPEEVPSGLNIDIDAFHWCFDKKSYQQAFDKFTSFSQAVMDELREKRSRSSFYASDTLWSKNSNKAIRTDAYVPDLNNRHIFLKKY